jgi:hypothetical protein
MRCGIFCFLILTGLDGSFRNASLGVLGALIPGYRNAIALELDVYALLFST